MIKYPYLFKLASKINNNYDFFYTNFDWNLDVWLSYLSIKDQYEQDYW